MCWGVKFIIFWWKKYFSRTPGFYRYNFGTCGNRISTTFWFAFMPSVGSSSLQTGHGISKSISGLKNRDSQKFEVTGASVLCCAVVSWSVWRCAAMCYRFIFCDGVQFVPVILIIYFVAVWCSLQQCVAVCCSVRQYVAVICRFEIRLLCQSTL